MSKQFKTEKTFDANIDQVWSAWTNTDEFAQWFGPTGFKARVKSFDFTPGGALHSCLYNDFGMEMWAIFVYRQITPKTHIAYEHSFSDAEGGLTRHPMAPVWPLKMLTNLHFEDLGDKTKVTVTWDPIEASDAEVAAFEAGIIQGHMELGWAGTWSQLAAYLGKKK